MSKINEKRALKLKAMESQNSSLKAQLEDSQATVTQLEDQCNILSNNLIDVGKENALLREQVEKASKDLEALKKELIECKAEKADLTGKFKMATSELATTTTSLDHMNKGSKKFDGILSNQVLNSAKHGIGFVHGASTSKSTGKSVFVRGPTLFSMTPIIHNVAPMKYVNANYKHARHNKFILICHFYGIKGHIRPHCNKLRNHLRNQHRKKHYSPQQVKTKSV